MSVKDFIEHLEDLNFSLMVEGSKLVLKGNKARLSADKIEIIKQDQNIIQYIKENKEEIIRYLSLQQEGAAGRPGNISAMYRLSGLQQGMLFHSLYSDKVESYINQLSCTFTAINIDWFKKSWDYLLKHHTILRSGFHYDAFNIPIQCVYTGVSMPIEEPDYRDFPEIEQKRRIEEYREAERQRGFDLKQAPLMRIGLIRIKDNQYRMIWTSHHILYDGWSMPIIIEEFLTTYELLAYGLSVVPKQEDKYEDYIRYIESRDKEKERLYWQHYLEHVDKGSLLPFINAADERTKGIGAYAETGLLFDGRVTRRIQAYAQQHAITMNTLMQGVWAFLLYNYTGSKKVVYGTTLSGRPADLHEIERRVGMYINTLPLMTEICHDQLIAEWLQQLQQEQLTSREYQYTYLNDIKGWLNLQGDLFDSLLVFENYPVGKLLSTRQWHLQVADVQTIEHSNYPLNIMIGAGDELSVYFRYNTRLLDESCIKRIRAHFEQVLLQIVDGGIQKTGEIAFLPEPERNQLVSWSQGEVTDGGASTVPAMFEEQVICNTQAEAVIHGSERLSYSQLDKKAQQIARQLQAKAVVPGELIALCTAPGPELVAAILGIWKAGAAYVPVDPAWPAARRQELFEDAGCRIVIADAGCAQELLSWGYDVINLQALQSEDIIAPLHPVTVTAGQLAYVLYTSGSSGKPKGVMVSHGSLHNYIVNSKKLYIDQPARGSYVHLSFTFDASLTALWAPLVSGLAIVIGEGSDAALLQAHSLLQQAPYNFIKLTPAHLPLLAQTGVADITNRLVIGGEALSAGQLAPLAGSGVQVVNEYGPTEATVGCCVYIRTVDELLNEATGAIPIGKPMDNVRLYIVDEQGSLAPVGVAGELWIGGVQVAQGYWKRPELTAEKFIADPFSKQTGARVYRSGDRCRWLADGNIEFLGRMDEQIKIRGYRIEPAEVEAVLQAAPGVQQAVVVVKADTASKQLLAYITGQAIDRSAVHHYLQERLPEYMIPAALITMDALPLTPHGKVDKRQLPEPGPTATTGTYAAPRNQTETILATIWQELLEAERVGINDNFFELGGDSIITIQVVSRARRQGIALQVGDLFTSQTIASLSALLHERRQSGEATGTGEQGVLTGAVGLLPVQTWFLQRAAGAVSHFNQSVLLELDKTITNELLQQIVALLLAQHDTLRLQFNSAATGWQQQYAPPEQHPPSIQPEDLSAIEESQLARQINDRCSHWQSALDIEKGQLVQVVRLRLPASAKHDRLLIVIHHLAVDGVSWRILLEDLEELLNAAAAGKLLQLSTKTTSYRQWQQALMAYGQRPRVQQQTGWWQQVSSSYRPLPVDKHTDKKPLLADATGYSSRLSKEATRQLLQELPKVYHTEVNDALLSALLVTISEWTASDQLVIGLEGHGREGVIGAYDTSRTVGWFTTMYPVRLQQQRGCTISRLLCEVKEQLRAVPDKGMGYGVLKYLHKAEALQGAEPWDILFNYLGQLDNAVRENNRFFSAASEARGMEASSLLPLAAKLSINAYVYAGELTVNWTYSHTNYEASTIARLAERYIEVLQELLQAAVQQAQLGPVATPSDYGLGGEVSVEELEAFLNEPLPGGHRRDHIEAMYRLSGVQHGMLFHSLYDGQSGAYVEQFSCELRNVNLKAFESAWDALLNAHSILRSAFYYDIFRVPVQAVYRKVELPIEELDYRGQPVAEQQRALSELLSSDRQRGFSFHKAPLMRITLVRLNEEHYFLLWTSHHVLYDGWSMPVLMEEFLRSYEQAAAGSKPSLLYNQDKYEDYIRYIESRDKEAEEVYWRRYLGTINKGTLLPFISTKANRNKGIGQYREEEYHLDEALTEQIHQYAQQWRITVNTVMQGVWAYLLHCYTGNEQVTYGVTVSGRPEALPGVERRVGMYINTLPLITSINAKDQIGIWLQELQQQQSASRQYQYTPLSSIQGYTQLREELFDTVLIYENYPVSKVLSTQNWQLEVENIQMNENNNYLLNVIIVASRQIRVIFKHNSDLLDKTYIEGIRECFENVLRQIVESTDKKTGDLRLLSPRQEKRLLTEFSSSGVQVVKEGGLAHWFSEQANATPHAIALVSGADNITYGELEERANRLAHFLREKGIREESIVALCLTRGTAMIVSILGVLKAGGAYLPIDPQYPESRKHYMLSDAKARLLLCEAQLHQWVQSHEVTVVHMDQEQELMKDYPSTALEHNTGAQQLAYIIYTSGSTGKPKGVMIEHRSVMNLIAHQSRTFGISADERILQFSNYCFDASVEQIFLALLNGATLVLINEELLLDHPRLYKLLREQRITHLHATPGFLESLEADSYGGLRRVIAGGEACKRELALRWNGLVDFYNKYGPTETTVTAVEMVWARGKELRPEILPIGRPLSNTQVYLLDEQHQPVPIGVAGELYIGGVQLARGYLNQPALTAERFIENPFGEGRLYRSGDLAKWLPNGNIVFLSRRDSQVKVRGYRIELGEVEEVLLQAPGIRQSVVIAGEDHQRLIAYVVADEFNREAILKYLGKELPDYMIPAYIERLDHIPLTSNGKVDTRQLPAVDMSAATETGYEAPRNEMESKLAVIWSNLLEAERIGIHDDFFALGGHSLLAVRVLVAIRKEFNVDIPVAFLFEYPTIALLAAHIETSAPQTQLPRITRRGKIERLPLSYSQERLWFIDRLQGSVQYHTSWVFRLRGELDVAALETSLRRIVERHEVLRTVIREEQGVGYQQVLEPQQWNMHQVEAAAILATGEELSSYINQQIMQPFDLSSEMPLRILLIRQSSLEYILVAVVHHIAFDGWSIGILVEELVELYRSRKARRAPALKVLPVQYADYALWQRQHLAGSLLEDKVRYWKEQLQDLSPLNLPTDYARPAIQSIKGGGLGRMFSKELKEALLKLSQQQGTTLFMTLLAAFKILLARYSGQQDICVGTAVAGRQHHEVEGLIGFFINTLALRTHISAGASMTNVLQAVKQTTLQGFSNQEVPLEKIVEALGVTRDRSRNPLFQVLFTLQNAPGSVALDLGGIELTADPLEGQTTQFDLIFNSSETPEGLHVSMTYCSDLYSEATINRMLSHYELVLWALVNDGQQKVGAINLLSEAEQTQLNNWSQGEVTDAGAATVPAMFEEQVTRNAQAEAVIHGSERLSYADLHLKSIQLASRLQSSGVQTGELVALCTAPGPELVAAILGIWKAGAAYVPVDPAWPAARRQELLEDAGCRIVIANAGCAQELLSWGYDVMNLQALQSEDIIAPPNAVTVTAGQLAYVLYTSGSGGQPKGVMVSHGSLHNYIVNSQKLYIDQPARGSYVHLSFTFDASLTALWAPLVSGLAIVIGEGSDAALLQAHSLLQQAPYNFIKLTPAHLPLLAQTGVADITNRLVIGGEALSAGQLAPLAGSGVQVVNEYGPTEATVGCCVFVKKIDELLSCVTGAVPIGKPMDNVRLYIVDEQGSLAPVGVAGELWIGGVQVAQGYWKRPELTAEKFIADPFSKQTGARVYRSGDRCRWLADGNIEFLGRMDEQIKIRGYRIEPAEVEAVLQAAPGVQQAVVVVKADTASKQLLAYITGQAIDRSAVHHYLQERLPEYMIPAALITMDALPLTPHGKVDKRQLPEPGLTATTGTYAAPRNQTETILATIWQELLEAERVGINDNFFELGGDSIITIQVVSRARRQGIALQVGDLFTSQTIASLSALLHERRQSGEATGTGEQGVLTGAVGLLPVQTWFLQRAAGAVSHFNQSVLLELDKTITNELLQQIVALLLAQHDTLRLQFNSAATGWQQQYAPPEQQPPSIQPEDLSAIEESQLARQINDRCSHWQSALDIEKGQLVQVVRLRLPASARHDRLLIVIHHLAVDGVSWRILLEDLEELLNAAAAGKLLQLSTKTTSYRQWQQALMAYGQRPRVQQQTGWWQQVSSSYRPLPVDKHTDKKPLLADATSYSSRLSKEATRQLLQELPKVYHTEVNDALLSALLVTISEWTASDQLVIGLEGHGREGVIGAYDTSRTVGWFTTMYPVRLQQQRGCTISRLLCEVKEQLRAVPDKGMGYGVLKYLHKAEALQGAEPWDILFNYLGQLDNAVRENNRFFSAASEARGMEASSLLPLAAKLSINAYVYGGELTVNWTYSHTNYEASTIARLAERYIEVLQELLQAAVQQAQLGPVATPSDYGLGGEVSVEELEAFLNEPLPGGHRRDHIEAMYRLSGLQQGMLFHSLYDGHSGAYIEQFSCELIEVNLPAFRSAWDVLLQAHSILRSAFYYGAFTIPVQCVYRKVQLPIEEFDYSHLSTSEQQQHIEALLLADRRHGFAPDEAPLMRLTLVRLSANRHFLLWTSHHILYDGWSMPVLMEEFLRSYEQAADGNKPSLLYNQDKYEDYIRFIEKRDKEAEEAYWRRYMSAIAAPSLLPFVNTTTTERTRTAGRYNRLQLVLDEATTAQIQQYAQHWKITVNTVMQGVWAYLLYRYTGNAQVVYGVTVSGRPEALPGVERRVGMYINTLPLVTTINDEEQTGIWLQQLQQQQSASRQYQYTPLSSIQGWAQQHEALFDTLLIYENYPVAKVLSTQDWRLQVANIQVREQTNYPLSVEVGVGKEISIRLEYNTRLLNSFQTEQIRDHIKQVLLQMAANVHGSITDIHMLPAWEEKLLLETFQGKKAAMDPGKTVIDWFKQQVLQHPHAIAVKQAEKQLSYTALEERSNQVANFLIEKGIQKEALVVICMPRGIEMIAAILGCWKAGAAYVPVDPNYPQQRISYIIEETGATIVLNEDRQHDISAAPTTAPGIKVSAEQLAYIIYTSGSTGRPKGAMIEHAGMLNHLLAKITELEMDANTRIAQTAASTFDISVWQMMAALICGGTTIVYNDEVIYEPQKILSCFEQDAITIAELVPSYLNSVLEETPGAGLTALQFLLVTGEAVHPSTLQKWFQFYPGKRVVNAYGPTEASDDICHYHMSDVPDAYTIPIGKPIQNLSIQITDKKGRLCPIGIDGEINVTGVGVGRGYWKDAEKTQKSFKENIPGSYSRCYKTGDVGRWQPDGTILYLGRMDEQVKIRGYRVELGEIENALHEYPGIRQGAVVARENTNGEKQLFGYFVAETAISRSDLDNYLKERLPAYMVPAMLTQLTGLPVTPNGKLDKASLAAVTLHHSTEKASHAPQTETEKMLADIWQSILKIERIGIYDNVFELGAHSLLIIKAIAQIRKIAGLEIPVRVMFQFNNIHDQAKYVELTGSINSLPQNAGHQQIIEL